MLIQIIIVDPKGENFVAEVRKKRGRVIRRVKMDGVEGKALNKFYKGWLDKLGSKV